MLHSSKIGICSPALVGVLGGMGPQATVDFLNKLVANTPANCDQEHVPVLIASVPQIPDRTRAFKGLGESPLPTLIANARRLIAGGARIIVMPCNTAHLWFDALSTALPVPMMHIVDSAIDAVTACSPPIRTVGLLATKATLDSGLYVRRSGRAGHRIEWRLPTCFEVDNWIMPAIQEIKAGRSSNAAPLLKQAAEALISRGAGAILLGCTELPLGFNANEMSVPVVDAGESLARQTVAWYRSHHTL